MEVKNQSLGWKINYHTAGCKYYVVTEHSGAPAANFYYQSRKLAHGLIMPRDGDSSADLK
ncbi:hypothetical protein [Desulfallas thermosapovorans]|uniref:Uncharacterized protein n=1 Tax=Desulfallas thermosapovorans DSM 6562 TaxID=1121431 RepID=A0A5S4ZXQ9_9FIRM|nr:hypothetical protein [Desulfallas thermosapovorans]TYO97874.1 hypothetical protein LX24_00158 [Desulfallas thermosapovorans DSM 6562]